MRSGNIMALTMLVIRRHSLYLTMKNQMAKATTPTTSKTGTAHVTKVMPVRMSVKGNIISFRGSNSSLKSNPITLYARPVDEFAAKLITLL